MRLHGLRQGPEPDRVHLLIPHAQQVRSWRLFHVERTSRMPRAIERASLAVAPLARAVLDEVRTLRYAREIAACLAELVAQRFVYPPGYEEVFVAEVERKTIAEHLSVLQEQARVVVEDGRYRRVD